MNTDDAMSTDEQSPEKNKVKTKQQCETPTSIKDTKISDDEIDIMGVFSENEIELVSASESEEEKR